MSRGLGAFAKGLAEGYVTGAKIKSQREKDEREKEMFGLQKQQTELQMQNAQIDLDRKRAEDEYQKDLRSSLAQIEQEARGRVTGEAIDEMSGQSLGQMTVAPGQAPGSGLRFREGTVVEQKPLSPVDYQFRVADTLKQVAARHGKIDLNLLEQSRKFGQKVKAEGAVEAMKYYMGTQDAEGARKMFNEKGGIKLGDDVQLGLKPGLFGPTMYGYKVDKDGKQIEVFDGFRDIILPSMSPEAYATTMASFAQIEAKEKGDTFRTGMTAQATRDAAAAKEGQKLSPEVSAFNERMNKEFEAVFKGAGTALNPQQETFIRSEMSSLGRGLIDRGMNSNDAYATALREVFTKYGISMPKPVSAPTK